MIMVGKYAINMGDMEIRFSASDGSSIRITDIIGQTNNRKKRVIYESLLTLKCAGINPGFSSVPVFSYGSIEN